jgi:hypothetical protein
MGKQLEVFVTPWIANTDGGGQLINPGLPKG